MLDLSINNKSVMTVKIPIENGENEVISVLPPKRRLLSRLQNINNLTDVEGMYEIIAEILSNNRSLKTYSLDDIEEFDICDVEVIILGYIEFIESIKKK